MGIVLIVLGVIVFLAVCVFAWAFIAGADERRRRDGEKREITSGAESDDPEKQ